MMDVAECPAALTAWHAQNGPAGVAREIVYSLGQLLQGRHHRPAQGLRAHAGRHARHGPQPRTASRSTCAQTMSASASTRCSGPLFLAINVGDNQKTPSSLPPSLAHATASVEQAITEPAGAEFRARETPVRALNNARHQRARPWSSKPRTSQADTRRKACIRQRWPSLHPQKTPDAERSRRVRSPAPRCGRSAGRTAWLCDARPTCPGPRSHTADRSAPATSRFVFQTRRAACSVQDASRRSSSRLRSTPHR